MHVLNATFSSWPGLSRPSTSFLVGGGEDVDARHKAGHDDVGESASYLLFDKPAP
jgi:hypothetical protein